MIDKLYLFFLKCLKYIQGYNRLLYYNSNLKYSRDSFIVDKLLNKINIIEKIGNNWHEDGIPAPTIEVLNLGRKLIPDLVKNFDGNIRVTQTVDEGLAFVFTIYDYKLYLELYNDGDIGYISTNEIEKKIIECDVISEDQIISVISKFNKIY